jgi:hypothetical protein
MEFKTLAEFQTLLSDVQARKQVLWEEILSLQADLAAKQNNFDEAILEGADPEELQAELESLQKKIDLKTREWHALDAATSGKARTGKIREAARAVWQEGTDLITVSLRAEWDAELVELEKVKAMYLAAVSALGKIKRKADGVTSKLSYGLEAFLPRVGAPHLATGIYDEKYIGVIFPDYHEIKKAYQNGGLR